MNIRLLPMLADYDPARAIGPILTAILVPMALGFFMRSAQKESIATAGSRSAAYPKVMRIFVVLGWVFTLGIAILAGFAGKDDVLIAAAVVALFVALILPLHLETFGVGITWDETNIYTRSPWRKRRTIPLATVTSCDFSAAMMWYRIHTEGHGIVRLHLMMRGIPEFLAALPCSAPPYPPNAPQPRSRAA